MWLDEGVVIPPTVKRQIFVTCSMDNCDISGRFEYHGTIYTITAHVTQNKPGVDPKPLSLSDVPADAEIKIPKRFSTVPLVDESPGDIKLTPIPTGTVKAKLNFDARREIPENEWINHAKNVFTAYKAEGDTGGKLGKIPVTWSGYHSHNQNAEDIRPPASIGIFPEFYNKAASMSLQKHGMVMMREAIDMANPGQVTVIVGYGPLYKIMK